MIKGLAVVQRRYFCSTDTTEQCLFLVIFTNSFCSAQYCFVHPRTMAYYMVLSCRLSVQTYKQATWSGVWWMGVIVSSLLSSHLHPIHTLHFYAFQWVLVVRVYFWITPHHASIGGEGVQFLLISGSIELACRKERSEDGLYFHKEKLWHVVIGGWEWFGTTSSAETHYIPASFLVLQTFFFRFVLSGKEEHSSGLSLRTHFFWLFLFHVHSFLCGMDLFLAY
ncbi:MAG: hypothetical protein JOS17DRAFT_48329 [Linnemannia elongata]|nr:MAG: hypothetical protein JOS17DRAFT_48329 [Linnemannia elongata]